MLGIDYSNPIIRLFYVQLIESRIVRLIVLSTNQSIIKSIQLFIIKLY